MRVNKKEQLRIKILEHIVFSRLTIDEFSEKMNMSVIACARKINSGFWSQEEKYKLLKLNIISDGRDRSDDQ